MAKVSQAKIGNTTYDIDAARFGTCSTSSTTAAKTVTLTTGALTELTASMAGIRVTVNFTNANTATSAPTLNVNSKGAKNIYVNGAQMTSTEGSLLKGVCNFIYDGTVWHLIGGSGIAAQIVR